MKNRTLWKDESGGDIQAHGGCILQYGGRWYWYGENKSGPTHACRVEVIGFSCYSSADLIRWKNEGLVLRAERQPGHDLSPEGVAERPVVLYNVKTRKFVMWFHLDSADYTRASVGLAVSDSPCGPFEYRGCRRPLGHDSRDMNAFLDRDGRAYLFCSSDWNATMRIFELDENYTALTGASRDILIDQAREAPAVFQTENGCYMLSSACTGWNPNTMLYAHADNVWGSWRLLDDPCTGPDARRTFYGQSAHVFAADGAWYLLLDHWNPQDLASSGYSILPVLFENGQLTVPWQPEWNGPVR